MPDGIEAQPALVRGRGVAEIAGGVAVRRLVQGNGKQHRHQVHRNGLDYRIEIAHDRDSTRGVPGTFLCCH